MPIPTAAALRQAAGKTVLHLDAHRIDHPAFPLLLQALGAASLSFSSPTVSEDADRPGALAVDGESRFFDLPLKKADFYCYPEAASPAGYEFEWHGQLPAVTLAQLHRLGILKPAQGNGVAAVWTDTFTGVDVLFTSRDRAFCLESAGSDLSFDLPDVGIRLRELGFLYERSLDGSIRTTHQLYATVQLGATHVSVRIGLPAGNPMDFECWMLELAQPVSLRNGLQDVSAFLAGQSGLREAQSNQAFKELPEVIRALPDMVLHRLDASIDPAKPAMHQVNGIIQTSGAYELLPGFVLRDAGLLFFAAAEAPFRCQFTLYGRFDFSDAVSVGLKITFPLHAGDSWYVEMDGSLDFERFQELEALPFLRLSELNLPDEWLQVRSVHLDTLKLVFNPTQRKIQSAKLALQLNGTSSPIPGIRVKDPYLNLNLNFK